MAARQMADAARQRTVAEPGQMAVPTRLPVRGPSRAAVRRRQVLAVMAVALAVPALAAVATGSTVAWWVVVALLPLVCAYLAVLFHNRRLLAEREINSAFIGSADRTEATLAELFADPFEHLDERPERLRAAGGRDW
jgi:fatty acid desaturase